MAHYVDNATLTNRKLHHSQGRDPLLNQSAEEELPAASAASVPGKVYLIYSHNLGFYKIGESDHVERRMREIRASVPGQLDQIHVLETDDPAGIEQYWHSRFREKKQINEWFKLTESDVEAFKRRGHRCRGKNPTRS